MDPSSFASVAASLLGVTIQITGSLYGNWEYSSLVLAERLIYELLQVRDVLQSLEATALSVTDVVNPPPKDLLLSLGDMKTCLISLGSKLLKQDPQSVFSFQDWPLPWRSFNAPMSLHDGRLPLSPAEATSDIQRLQACLSNLNASVAKSVFAPPEELVPKLVANPTGSLWKDRAEYVDFHENTRKSRLDGTGRWFVNHHKFQNWLTAERSPNTLFCPGKPGSGKTILTSLVIDEVRKWQKDKRSPPNIGLAYFYFSYKTPSSLRNVALALLEQLHLQSSSIDEQVARLENLATKADHIPFSDIVSAVIAVSKKFHRAYIVIDALDECPPDYQNDLLYLLTWVKNSPARLLASSRPHLTFDIFNKSPTIAITPSEQDILLYTDYRLQALPARYDNLRDRIIEAVLKTGNRHRMFLPIVMQLNEVLSKTTAKDILRELGKDPGRLSDLYRDLLLRIQDQEPDAVQIAKRTLAWLFYAQRPLETSELLEAHRHASPKVEVDASLIVKSCMGLVISEPKIAFAHFSVKEFLENDPFGDEEEVASHCLSYIGSCAVDRIADSDNVDSLMESNPLLSYAADYWGCHLRNLIGRKSDVEPAVLKKACLSLLKDEQRVAVLCHIVFRPLRRLGNSVAHSGLVKSSSLHLAAYFGLDWAIDTLIVSLDSATKLDEWDRTPLHIAAENGFDKSVWALLARISPDQQDAGGRTAWHYAAMSGNPKSIHQLVAWSLRTPSANRPSPVINLGADKMGRGKSPLEYAAVNGNAEAFRAIFILYTAQSSGNEKLRSFMANAMSAALLGGKIEIVEFLLMNGQAPDYEHLLVAIKAGFEDIVQLLLEYGVEVDNQAQKGESAIVVAARAAHNKILQFLIWNGAPEGIDRQVQAALPLAVKTNNPEGVRILLDAGAEAGSSVDGWEKLIVYAARRGMRKIVELLLANGAKVTEAAFPAIETGQVEILKLLQGHGLPADLKSEAGQSLLEAAREAGNAAIVQLLQNSDSNSAPRVVYLPSSDNPVDIQTSKRRSPPHADAALPDKSSQTPTLKQKEPALSRLEVPRSTDNAVTETAKPANTASGGVKYAPATSDAPGPTDSMSATSQRQKVAWSPTAEVRWNASENLLPTEEPRGVMRAPVLAVNPIPFLLLSEPIEMGIIGLGSVVAAPRDPLSGYAPEHLKDLDGILENFRSISVQHDYASINDRRSTSGFALEVLRPILNYQSSQTRSISLDAPRVSRERLHNHERVVERILHENHIRHSILQLMMGGPNRKEERKELFLVVGLLVATDLRTVISQQEAAESNIHAAFALESQVRHQGDKIFAISYRSIKARTRRSFFGRKDSGFDPEHAISLGDYFSPKSHERLS